MPDPSANGKPELAGPLAEARALARELRASGKFPFDITMSVLRVLAAARITTPTAQDLVRELPGLEHYRVLDDYQRRASLVEGRYGDALADLDGDANDRQQGREYPTGPAAVEMAERRAGERLAEQLRRHKEQMKPVLLDMVAPEMGEIAADVTEDVLARHKKEAHGG
jgi:hypothetical protein